jgi:hypothetical protein
MAIHHRFDAASEIGKTRLAALNARRLRRAPRSESQAWGDRNPIHPTLGNQALGSDH